MKKSQKGMRYGTVFFILVTAVILTAIATYFYVSNMVSDLGRNQQIYSKLNKVNDLINKNYILPIDPVYGNEQILDGIVEGYIDGLGDPYSYYLNETNYRISSNAATSTGVGIGVLTTFDKETGGVKVTFVKRNSPAESAGMESGDVITAVNGTPVTELGFRNAVYMLSGAEGSDVVVSFLRDGEVAPVTLTLTRMTYDSNTVEYRLLESGNGIGYISINEFAASTVSEFSAAVESLRDTGARGFIIDVRFNAGGDFPSMRNVLDKVMPAGIMCSVKELASETTLPYYSSEGHLPEKIVVLQNFATSDVAEVFAAALRDASGAVLVGDTSFGKGVGQRDIPLSDGSAIHISTFAYVTPNGEEFNGVGISPDVAVALPEEKVLGFGTLAAADDDQLQAAITQMRTLLGG
ncbi:MAG: PDZ domain-containing protein [Clostridia bacterium]|nr:PDZ domain-containing protein [Clostridia bacterium]MBQ4322985.1 PDZ domain-containing protein [Clostridia bacterium]